MGIADETWSEDGVNEHGLFRVIDNNGNLVALTRLEEHARAVKALPKLAERANELLRAWGIGVSDQALQIWIGRLAVAMREAGLGSGQT